MRFLVRFRDVASMTGVDATRPWSSAGRRAARKRGWPTASSSPWPTSAPAACPTAEADFVWGEDAWCYVVDKAKLIAEAARLVKPGGTIAFTDWVEGPAGLSDEEATAFLVS